jgi:hypothetical protein
VLLLAGAALAAASLTASDAPLDRATLRGLKALKVIVELPDAELAGLGVSSSALAARAEQRLAKSGIPIDRDAVEFLGVRVTAAHAKRTSYALCMALGLYQTVSMARDATLKTSAETWSTESVALVPPKVLQEALENTVDQLVDQFITAFRSVNPATARLAPRTRRMMYGCLDFIARSFWPPAPPA